MKLSKSFALAAAALGLAGAVPAMAAEVNVYTSREPDLIKPVFEAFTKATGVKVNAVFLQNGLEERVRAEGQNSPADVIVLVDAARLVNAADMGITQNVSSPTLTANVPAQLRDPNGAWFATTLRSRVVYASKERVKQDAITYEELADPKWKGRVCIRSGQHPYNVSLIAAMVTRHGAEKTAEWLKGVKANLAKKPSGGDREVAKDILAGVCDIGVGNTYYVGLLRNDPDAGQRAWGEAVKVLDSSFAGGGAHVNISGAAVAKYAPHKAEAVQFIEFMTSDAAQKLVADVNYEYPVRASVPDGNTEKLFGPIKPDSLSLADIARNRKTASELVDRVGFDN
ncbi:Fe(3+) ABC transporter substrate-binding protein [Alsobacter sp. SYSU M60028]|uniref:Fe(3+) ABC transporter substrate-binding protein n=1 Tax=Alsobacter ponti TaxID=2962936 RepID=A0ABT1LJK7_9HYPH|nr:Fe(3+) ABC transporter substrate-binding protein [Alsobacter ponti]MCP8941121.1 Fe(3+) ABC transporter substrate-binding protein [Alsobacter ponti]